MGKIFKEVKPRTINYSSYKHFSDKAYILHELSKKVFINNDDALQSFCDININILNRLARKRKHRQKRKPAQDN